MEKHLPLLAKGCFMVKWHGIKRTKASIPSPFFHICLCFALLHCHCFSQIVQTNIAPVLSKENDQTLADIDSRLEELQTQLLKLVSSKADYEDVAEEIHHLREQKQKAQVESAGRDELRKKIDDMSTFLLEQPTTITEYDEQLVRRLIEKVTVHEDKFTVEFKSGVTVDVDE